MRLRDRFNAAVQAFREAPDLRAQLDASEHERKLANQALEQSSYECFILHDTIEEKDARMRFLEAKSEALSYALTEFVPKLTATDEMKRFYDAVAYSLDPAGFTLYRVAKDLAGADVTGLFPYEDARGTFEEASGHQLMGYLTACCFGTVEWEIVPGTTYERAVLGEVDTSTPEYQRFESQLYRSVLERMGFDGLLVPKQSGQTAEQAPAQNEIETMAM